MSKHTISWDDFMLAIYEGLDGIDYPTAKKIHEAMYPEAKVRAARDNCVTVEWPAYKEHTT